MTLQQYVNVFIYLQQF